MLAMYNYLEENGTFPPAAKTDPDGKPLLSWRVLILPYLEPQTSTANFISTSRGTALQQAPCR